MRRRPASDGAATWETAFVATAVLLGDPIGAAVDTLGSSAVRPISLIRALQLPSRDARARALAGGISRTIVVLEALRLG